MTDAAESAGTGAADAVSPPPFEAGTNVLVVGETDGAALEFAVSRLLAAGGPVTVVSTDLPAASVAAVPVADPPDGASLHVVDCTEEASAAVPDGPAVETTVAVEPGDLPSVGEATAAALDGDGTPPPVGVCLDSLSSLVTRSSVQQVYKLLYVLSRRVRSRDAVAFYTWDGPSTDKTLRILGRTLDYRVSLDAPDGPRVSPLDGQPDGGG
jgi:hypothetical protein